MIVFLHKLNQRQWAERVILFGQMIPIPKASDIISEPLQRADYINQTLRSTEARSDRWYMTSGQLLSKVVDSFICTVLVKSPLRYKSPFGDSNGNLPPTSRDLPTEQKQFWEFVYKPANDYNPAAAAGELESPFMWPSLNKALYCGAGRWPSCARQSGLVREASVENSVQTQSEQTR